jgi:hypothetical protein
MISSNSEAFYTDHVNLDHKARVIIKLILEVVGYEKVGWVGRLANVPRWFKTIAIDVCLLFNVVVVFSSTYFCFRFVKNS